MGGIESKFNGLLTQGQEMEAVEMWDSNVQLLHQYDPNAFLRWNKHGDTPLHCAARFEMHSIMTRLMQIGGNPFLKNSDDQTPLHLVCRSARSSSRTSKRRSALLELLLSKVTHGGGAAAVSGPAERPKSDEEGGGYLDLKDKAKNTPLHLAATSGLLDCVERLLAHGAPLFVCNIAGQTPCDAAASAKQLIVAKLLESRMVLMKTDNLTRSTKSMSFYTSETLQTLKNEIVKRLATKLEISLSSAEILLQGFGWSEELVKKAWKNDKAETCKRAGLDVGQVIPGAGNEMSLTSSKAAGTSCAVCFEDIPSDQRVFIPCKHLICNTCWPRFLEVQIQQAGGREIRCPAYGCFRVVPNEVIATMVSTDLFKHYTTLNLQQFVSEYGAIKWCPHPGCGLAVGVPKQKSMAMKKTKASLNVWCEKGHAFCWTCNQEAHEPCGCQLWEKWKVVSMEMTAGVISHGAGVINRTMDEALANMRWLTSFTKPCPNCSVPIQRNEGCNHMTCKKCRFEFCWICFDSWSTHGSSTGGYFSCNRYKQQERARVDLEKATKSMEDRLMSDIMRDAEEKKKCFEHYHSRYIGHCQSVQIELKLFEVSVEKSNQLIMLGPVLERNVAKVKKDLASSTTPDGDSPSSGKLPGIATVTEPSNPVMKGNIFEDSLFILINSRQVLAASYALGYFISDSNIDKISHETMQGGLEVLVERLSQMLNRPYLCTPHCDLVQAAISVEQTCKSYLTAFVPIAQRASEDAQCTGNHS